MTAIGLIVLGAGVITLWAGVKGEDLREVIPRVLGRR